MEWKPLSYSGGVASQNDEAGAAEAPTPNLSAAAPSHDDRRQAPRRPGAIGEGAPDSEDDIDAVDAVDAELFPIFEEEALELLPQLAGQLRDWIAEPAATTHADGCMRTLHTLKGGARLAGAMRLGEMAHRLETRIERILAQPSVSVEDVDKLQSHSDALTQVFDALRNRDAQAYAQAAADIAMPSTLAGLGAGASGATDSAAGPATRAQALDALEPLAEMAATPLKPVAFDAPAQPPLPRPAARIDANGVIDWSRFANTDAAPKATADRGAGVSQSAVRVRAPLLDRLVNQAGEVSIARTRIETQVGQIKGSLSDLTDNLERLRAQLRDIELQAETQMTSRLEAAKVASQTFDPLEFDRFTRFQEVTRMMAESVNDVATVQRTLQRSLESAEDELVAQARMTRELQGDLLRTRMVEFEGLSDRLYRVVRQAAKETGKQVRLDIVGGSIEIDRGVLDRMTGAFEHVLRNSVTHGIESPQARSAAGKDPTGLIVVTVSQEGNEVGVEFRDDGAGLNLPRIRERGIAMGLLDAARAYSDAELANLIFASGFSTASSVTELAGRGVGMDVVRSEVNAIGGRIRTATRAAQGTSFKLILPLTTAVTQVLMLRCGAAAVAVPSTLIEIVRRATPAEIEQSHATGTYTLGERVMPFFWFGALLQLSPRSLDSASRTRTVVVIRSAQKRIAVQVDEVLGNQEVVVKNLGPQLSRVPGLAGITLLASGAVALIYNPVALATLYGDPARNATLISLQEPESINPGAAADAVAAAPTILVVDDSLTVRRVTQRLLVREGYRVVLAKDGLDALERLAEERPQVVLSDIEMPRMDGFDLVRNIRANPALRDLPVIMITSRIAQKHRDHAASLGVDHYMGKPYSEEDLLALIGHYAGSLSAA
jgi:chemosensory pili system protein ChpA (sensor histidine kinase/response regulator)